MLFEVEKPEIERGLTLDVDDDGAKTTRFCCEVSKF